MSTKDTNQGKSISGTGKGGQKSDVGGISKMRPTKGGGGGKQQSIGDIIMTTYSGTPRAEDRSASGISNMRPKPTGSNSSGGGKPKR